MAYTELKPTNNQTFEIVCKGEKNYINAENNALEAQRAGDVESACNIRFEAFQELAKLLPEEEIIELEWEHRNTRSALCVIYGSAIDHFLVGDFEMSAAMLEMLLDLDPEDHFESIDLLAFIYLGLGEVESMEEIISDISDKEATHHILMAWKAFLENGKLEEEDVATLKRKFKCYYEEFTSEEHPTSEEYLVELDSDKPSQEVVARELWLKTESLWFRNEEFIEELKKFR